MGEEISLKDIIKTLVKGKWIIAVIMVASILLSGIYGFFIAKPVYSATAILLTNPISWNENSTSLGGNIEEMISSVGKYPSMSIDTYREQFLNQIVLTNTINDLKLADKEGKPLLKSVLASKVSVESVNGTNLLKVKVNDISASEAALIANTLSKNFIDFISDNTRKIGEQASLQISEQMLTAEIDLEKQAKILQEYLKNSPNIDQMKLEVTALNDQITLYKSNLNDVEKQITSDSEALTTFADGKKISEVIKLEDYKVNLQFDNTYTASSGTNSNTDLDKNNLADKRNITDKNDVELQLSLNDSNLKDSLYIISMTELETRLVKNISEKNALEIKLSDMEKNLEELQSILTEEEYKYNAIKRNYDLAEQTYNAYMDRLKEAVITTASDIGKSAIIVSSPAVEPLRPSGYGKKFYLGIGAVIGLMIGIFVAFFRAYMMNEDNNKAV